MKYLLSILFLTCCCSLYANHLSGGEFSYAYIGKIINGSVLYQVNLSVYRDCSSSTKFDQEVTIGVYKASDSKLLSAYTMSLYQVTSVANCDPNCSERATYIDTILLPKYESEGFHIIWQRCCRSVTANLPTDINGDSYQGYMLYAFIPNATIANNSVKLMPQYPWYYNTNEATQIHFISNDRESDSISITVITPLRGASISDLIPSPPDIFPGFTSIDYNFNYSSSYPLGVSSTYTFNDKGDLLVFCPQPGKYEVAYDIKEYRKGVLVGRTIREILFTTGAISSNSSYYHPEKLTGQINSGEGTLTWEFCNLNKRKQYVLKGVNDSVNLSVIDSLEWYETAYTDPGLAPNTRYYYQVKAYTKDGKPMASDKKQLVYYGQGLAETELEPFRLGPVPVKDILHLQAEKSMIRSCEVYDITGRLMIQHIYNERLESSDLDCSSLPAGCYMLHICIGTGQTFIKKLIKE